MRCWSGGGVKLVSILGALMATFFGLTAIASAGPVVPIPSTLWQPPTSCLPPSGDYIFLASDPGDWVGGGRTYLYTPADAVLKMSISAIDGHLVVSVTGDEEWTGDFAPMSGLDQLQPGFYPDLERYPFNNPTKGGLDWYGEGRGSNELSGWFAVDDVAYDGAAITSIDLRFELHSEGAMPPLHGAMHLGSGTPAPTTFATLTATAPSVCRYGHASISGTLGDAATQPLSDASVSILSTEGGSWGVLASATTNASGAFSVAAHPTKATWYQAVYAGDPTCSGSTSAAVKILPKVFLSKPAAPRSARTTTSFLCSSTLKPRHPKGSHPILFECQHRQAGRWLTFGTVWARAADSAAGSKCSAKIRLTVKGAWRIRAVHETDDDNAATATGWHSVRVH